MAGAAGTRLPKGDRGLFGLATVALVLGAWLALVFLGVSPYAGYLDHRIAIDSPALPYLARPGSSSQAGP